MVGGGGVSRGEASGRVSDLVRTHPPQFPYPQSPTHTHTTRSYVLEVPKSHPRDAPKVGPALLRRGRRLACAPRADRVRHLYTVRTCVRLYVCMV